MRREERERERLLVGFPTLRSRPVSIIHKLEHGPCDNEFCLDPCPLSLFVLYYILFYCLSVYCLVLSAAASYCYSVSDDLTCRANLGPRT